MSYEAVIEQVKETPAEFLDEVSVFLSFLKYRSQHNVVGAKTIDAEYNTLVAPVATAVTNTARATLWEQLKDDSW